MKRLRMDLPSAEEMEKAVRELFAEAKTIGGMGFINAMACLEDNYEPLSERRKSAAMKDPKKTKKVAWNAPQMALRELEEFIRQLIEYIGAEYGHDGEPSKLSKKEWVRLYLIAYCHIMEARYPWLVFLNLLRHIDGEPAYALFRQKRYSTDKTQLPQEMENIYQKIQHLRRWEAKRKNKISEVLERLWQPYIRNAFLHHNYTISEDGDFEIIPNVFAVVEDEIAGLTKLAMGAMVPFKDIKYMADSTFAYYVCFRQLCLPRQK